MPELPLVSIVTPCFNMAEYLPETIESVLSQDYPNIEYIVMDGGSTDGTVEVLERYKDRIRYVSAPDRGASDAINRGFKMSQGSVFAWLNADDTYLPGAVTAAVRHLLSEPDAAAVYGQGYWVDGEGRVLRPYPTRGYSLEAFGNDCYICQPACFFRAAAFEEEGGLDRDLQIVFDYDLWIRIGKRHRLSFLPEYLATSRMHSANKTLADRTPVFAENCSLLKRHFGYIPFRWLYGRACFLLDKRDQFYEPLQPSILAYCLSLPLGVWHNARSPWRYLKEWFQVMTYAGLVRVLNRSALGRVFGSQSR